MSENNNPYSAPKADLQVEQNLSETEKVKVIPRFSAWAVFGLSIITLSVYAYYWLYSRSNMVNSELTEQMRIPKGLILSVFILGVLNLVSGLISEVILLTLPQGTMNINTLVIVANIIGLVSFVLYVINAFKLKNRINDLSGGTPGSRFWLGGFLGILGVIFIPSIYIQYKVNQMHDSM